VTHQRPRLGFAGTPEFAAIILAALIEHDLAPVVVYTQPDRPTGRGRKLQPSPVKILAEAHKIPVRQPASLKHESLSSDELDLLVVAAYGLLLPEHVLQAPAYGCINVHASLLPRWRGAAPVERAIMAGDCVTGVCLMQMEKGLDTGPVYDRQEVAITDRTTGTQLERQLASLGAQMLVESLADLDSLAAVPQQGKATYAAKLTRADSRIDWQQSAPTIAARVRALTGRLPVTCFCRGARVRILQAEPVCATDVANGVDDDAVSDLIGQIISADKHGISVKCGEGVLQITQLQLDRGKGRPLPAGAALNGYPELFAPGTRLDERPGE